MTRNTTEDVVTLTREEYDELVARANANTRFSHVEPAQFAALKTEFNLSSKDMAAAIGRTLSRVSELTKSKGASQQVYERVRNDIIAWREANPVQAEAESAEA